MTDPKELLSSDDAAPVAALRTPDKELGESTPHHSRPTKMSNRPCPSGMIAVIGMSGRFPGCDDLDGFWELLLQRKDVHQEIPPSRFNINDFHDPTGKIKNAVLTRYGCFLSHPGHFDARFFNISPVESAQIDPLHRLFLTTTYEALEMAGYNPDSSRVDKSRVSTYFGQSTDDWGTINEQQGIQAHYLPATNRSFAAGRVNHFFKFGGGGYSIDTGCSSSATAIHLACAALRDRECDMSVVGGGNICVIPEYFSGFSLGGFLSTTGACKTFSEEADGYCRGEAVGTLILKRLDDAVVAKDNILGVISATARNSNAGEGSITYPGEKAQVRLLKELLEHGETDASEIGFVEMHGTGTQAGDWVEMNTVRSVLANEERAQPVYVGAVKANVGHGEAAAGITSLIKALLMLKYDEMPGQPGDLVGGGSAIPRSKIDGRRKIIVNSFDAAGGNTSILLQDGPAPTVNKQPDPRTHHVVTVSGRTTQSLRRNRDRLRIYLEAHPGINVVDLVYTTTARRTHHVQREAYVVETNEQLITMLKQPVHSTRLPTHTSSLVFVFTGQSSQYTAMGATLYKTSPWFKNALSAYDTNCTSQGLCSFLGIIQGTIDIAAARPTQVHLATVALEIALAHFLQELGLKPTLVIGHSLGEYAALCISGVLSVSDTLYLVHERAVLMEKYCLAGRYGMMAIPLGEGDTQALLREASSICEICCINGPFHTVVGGSSTMLEDLEVLLKNKGYKPTRLNVPYAFHSTQMNSILPEFDSVVETIHFRPALIPVASTLTGAIVKTFEPSYLVRQCCHPVKFLAALKACEAEGLIAKGSIVMEIGPHPVCLGLVTSCLPDLELVTLATLRRGHSDWEVISDCLATAHTHHQAVNWEALHENYTSGLSLTHLPTYAFDSTDYWTPYQRQAIQGHVVDGAAISPASLFLDMACGAAQTRPATPPCRDTMYECVDLEMTTPLIVSKIRVNISSTSHGKLTEHATCRILLHNQYTSIWPQILRLILFRVKTLSHSSSVESGHHKMANPLFYKLFDSIVEYSAPFRILENITVDKDFQDAVAELRTPSTITQGTFTLHPFTVDALIHLPGFLLNCNFEKPKGDIYVAKSIDKVVVLENFRRRGVRPWTVYAAISQPTDSDGTAVCDTYLYRDGELAAFVSGICFQRVSRQSFAMITGASNGVLPTQHKDPDAGVETVSPNGESLWKRFLQIVAMATGIDMEEVKSANSFTELGVDSHMGISIIAAINKTTWVILPAAFFNNFPTLIEAEQVSNNPIASQEPSSDQNPKGRAILLQGNPKSLAPPLFLIAESSGSVAVYTHFPPLPNDTPIYGLESPFLQHPKDNTIPLPSLAKAYIATMRTVRPTGPYLIAGYSFAAVYAYEMTYQLALLGERLLGLIIIDMYVPPPAHNGTSGMKRFSLDGIGQGPLANITNRISQLFPQFTDDQKEHMRGSMQAASLYTPAAIPGGMEPYQTHLIWATRGVNENGNPEEFDDGVGGVAWMGVCEGGREWEGLREQEMEVLLRSWFFAPRGSFGTNGWEVLLGEDIRIHKVDADHLSLVAPPKVKELGKAIASAVGACTGADS
ncbi:hypothetical protein BDV12DRAFT_207611 [Aspergillus spectabilis]